MHCILRGRKSKGDANDDKCENDTLRGARLAKETGHLEIVAYNELRHLRKKTSLSIEISSL